MNETKNQGSDATKRELEQARIRDMKKKHVEDALDGHWHHVVPLPQ